MGDSDFTFCQVHTSGIAENISESPKIIPSIGNIVLDDGNSDVVGSNKIDDSPREDNSSNIDSIIEVGGSTSSELKTKNPVKQDSLGQVKGQMEPEQRVTRKPVARAKVPFEKGFSQMDWLKLSRSHPDLAGLKGQSNRRLISMDEVRQHKTGGAIWTVLKGRVYNILPYMKFHPGGADMLMKAAGKDCTSIFNKYHAWVNAEFLLEKCLVGILDDSQ